MNRLHAQQSKTGCASSRSLLIFGIQVIAECGDAAGMCNNAHRLRLNPTHMTSLLIEGGQIYGGEES
jgi:hypothetical protein